MGNGNSKKRSQEYSAGVLNLMTFDIYCFLLVRFSAAGPNVFFLISA